jgi:hypothetical protein
MDYPVAIPQVMEHMGYMLILGTGKHIHLYSDLSQLARQITDVNIHSSGILSTEGCQRTGMVR